VPVDQKLAQYLRRRGASQDEIEQAAAEGWLTLLAIDRSLFAEPAKYTREEIAERSGVDPEVSRLLWRALGFPDVPDGQIAFSEESVDVLCTLNERIEAWFMRRSASESDANEALITQVRALSAGFARVAEVLSDSFVDSVDAAHSLGLGDEDIARIYVENLKWDSVSRLFDYVLRLQLRAAAWRKLATEDDTATRPTLAVGFLDLVGYTALSQMLDEDEIGLLVARFEALTHDTIAQLGGRLVKTIGDEVMFVAESPTVAARIALRLTERTGEDAVLPDARAGIAYGPVVAREGDYYGPMVNLAHRLVEVAYPGTILVCDALHDALVDDPGFTFGRTRQRRIRDIGRVGTWPLRARQREPAG
jgi:adenylate cyclase